VIILVHTLTKELTEKESFIRHGKTQITESNNE